MTPTKHAAALAALAALALAGAAHAQPAQQAGDDRPATAEERKAVSEALAKVGCRPGEVEREGPDLIEVDDARCDSGQFDVKLDGAYRILSMTRDD